jgi:hypothetical protein
VNIQWFFYMFRDQCLNIFCALFSGVQNASLYVFLTTDEMIVRDSSSSTRYFMILETQELKKRLLNFNLVKFALLKVTAQ